MSPLILASCQAHSVQSCSIVTCLVYFASLLCSASQACTECYLKVNAVKRLSTALRQRDQIDHTNQQETGPEPDLKATGPQLNHTKHLRRVGSLLQ